MTTSADSFSRWIAEESLTDLAGVGAAEGLVAIVGATGTGKSELSLDLAEWCNQHAGGAEIVNADAMQLYRGMDIGTAKLPVSERRGITHHLFDVLDVTAESTVAAYQPAARLVIEDIQARGKTAVLVGGSGLYVSSVIFDFQFPGRDPEVRARLERELDEQGTAPLFRRLSELDPEAATAIGPHNGRRIVRALETIEVTGSSVSGALPESPVPWRPLSIWGLVAQRAALVARLDDRVRSMWASGLTEEVRSLIPRGLAEGVTARRAIGYAQALGQLSGELTEEEAITLTQALTRKYSRRQVSWFKRYSGVHTVTAEVLA